MAGIVEKLPGEPIILVTVDGHLNVEIAREIYGKIAEIAKTIEGPIFRIMDVRQQETTFIEMMGIIEKAP